MEDCEHDYAPGFDAVKDSVREARNEGAANFAVNARKGPELVPRSTRIRQRDPVRPSDGKRPAEPLASPGFGEHLVSRNDVVGVTLVFG